jgi:hypothetical protein
LQLCCSREHRALRESATCLERKGGEIFVAASPD